MLVSILASLGLTGKPLTTDSWLAGEEFVSLISFLGCSPHIILTPEEGENYCRIRWLNWQHPVFLGHTRSIQPRCPHCKNRINNWKAIPQIDRFDTPVSCPQCQLTTPASGLNWRHEGGYASAALIIEPVHPHEAVPADALLSQLQHLTQCEWRYCYVEETEQYAK